MIIVYILEFILAGYLLQKINSKLAERANRRWRIHANMSFIEKILNPDSPFKEKAYWMEDWMEHLNTPEEDKINKEILEVEGGLSRAYSSNLNMFIEPLKLKLKKLKNRLIVLEHEKELEDIETQKHQVEKEIEELEKKKRMIEWSLENDKREFLMKLNTYDNRVFKKEDLSKKEFQALIEDGFKQVNEYCVFEKKRIPVLVKPFGNHTISHEFLVWSVKRLIKQTDGIKKIKEHLTKDADLTFEFKGKEFALEIEKGDLLRKHNPLKEKIDYLNKEYPERWMIVVSNRDFFTKYKKYGFTSTRERLSENLSKLLKNAHTKIPIV